MLLRNLLWLFIVARAYVAPLSLRPPHFTISTLDASQLRMDTYANPRPVLPNTDTILQPLPYKPEPLTLGPADTLTLTFQITETDEGKGVQPHQTFIRFYDSVTGEEGIQTVRVTPGGRPTQYGSSTSISSTDYRPAASCLAHPWFIRT